MKNKILNLFIISAMISSLLIGCGKTEPNVTDAPKTYANPAIPTVAPKDTDSVLETTEEQKEATEASDSSKTDELVEENENNVPVLGTVEAIAAIGGLKSIVETDEHACIVYTNSKHNPYDVEYDYGQEYNAYVDECDWSLVFDADYYIKTFPTLALLYHDDKDLLLEHFATVGIHEGRQGSDNFNVGSYMANCDSNIAKTFGDNYECYYIYYMLNYNTEKSVDVKPTDETETQYKVIMTAIQAIEFEQVNKCRADVGVAPLEYSEPFSEFAAYRSYVNVVEGWNAHDWLHDNDEHNRFLYKYLDIIDEADHYMHGYGENNVTAESKSSTRARDKIIARYQSYIDSPEHYEAMINAKYDILGTSAWYYGPLPEKHHGGYSFGTYSGHTFDCFAKY